VIREEERRWRTGGPGLKWNVFLNTEGAEKKIRQRDFSLRPSRLRVNRPTRSQEANVKEKESACCARNDGVWAGVRLPETGERRLKSAPLFRGRAFYALRRWAARLGGEGC